MRIWTMTLMFLVHTLHTYWISLASKYNQCVVQAESLKLTQVCISNACRVASCGQFSLPSSQWNRKNVCLFSVVKLAARTVMSACTWKSRLMSTLCLGGLLIYTHTHTIKHCCYISMHIHSDHLKSSKTNFPQYRHTLIRCGFSLPLDSRQQTDT